MPELSVLIVTYNSADTVQGCLESVRRHSSGVDQEVLLFDNASSDTTVKIVEKFIPAVQLYKGEENLGFGRANNILLEKSQGEYILFLNPDTILPEGALPKLLEFVKNKPEAGAVGTRLAFSDGTYQISTAGYPSLRNELVTRLYHRALTRNILPVRRFLENRHKQATPVPWVGGACLLCSREKLMRIGGFDPNFFLYFEDIDLCKRLSEQGWKNYYLPEVTVIHQRGTSAASTPWVKELQYRRSQLYYYSKHLGPLSFHLLKFYLSLKFGRRWLGWKIRTALNHRPISSEQTNFYPALFKMMVQSKYRL